MFEIQTQLQTSKRPSEKPGQDDATAGQPLSQALFVGQAIDIVAAYRLPDALKGVNPLDPDKAGTHTFNLLGVQYTIPTFVDGIESTSGTVIEDSVTTRDGFQNSLAATASAAADIGAFSGQMSVSYATEYASSSDYSYAYRNFYQHVAVLQLNLDEALKARSDNFLAALDALPATVDPTNLEPFDNFFDTYGYYIASIVNLGGALEYSVAVSDDAQQSTTEIAANMKVEYNALFSSGSMSASVASTQAWQSYHSNRHVQISMLGGDPDLLSEVVRLAESAPDPTTADAYSNWFGSVAGAPAATRFEVSGIWNLGGDKSGVLQKAFDLIRSGIRPKLTIETSAFLGAPTIILGQPIIPPGARPASGIQVAVLDRKKMTHSGIVFSKYYKLRVSPDVDGYDEAGRAWQQMVADLKPYSNPGHILILATFDLDYSLPPLQQPPEYTAYSFLRGAGAGENLVEWVNVVGEPGSSTGTGKGNVTYVLVSIMGVGSSTGLESLALFPSDAGTVAKQVYFYRQGKGASFSLSDGGNIDGSGAAPDLRHECSVRGARQLFVAS
jgi:hypothetical protein